MPKQKSQLLEFFSLMDVWYPSKKQYFVHYRKKFLLCYICEYILKKKYQRNPSDAFFWWCSKGPKPKSAPTGTSQLHLSEEAI